MNLKFAVLILTLISCQSESQIQFFAIKGDEIIKFSNLITIEEFSNRSNELVCSGFRIVVHDHTELNSQVENFRYFASCENKTSHQDAIQLPIYKCNGFRKYGINLCDKNNLNLETLSEFYLNPNRRPDYPSKPKNAILRIIVDEKGTIEDVYPILARVQNMIYKVKDEEIYTHPILFTLNTIQKDSILLRRQTIKLME